MDTDDLSEKTYRAIMLAAEKFNPTLTLQFGLMSYECKDEEEFIFASKELIDEMLRYNKWELNDMFFGEPPPKEEFRAALKKISENIKDLKPIIDKTAIQKLKRKT